MVGRLIEDTAKYRVLPAKRRVVIYGVGGGRHPCHSDKHYHQADEPLLHGLASPTPSVGEGADPLPAGRGEQYLTLDTVQVPSESSVKDTSANTWPSTSRRPDSFACAAAFVRLS